MPYHQSSVTLNRNGHILLLQQEGVFALYHLSTTKEDLLLSQKPLNHWKTVTAQPMKSHYIVNSQLLPMESFVYNCLSELPLSSIKEHVPLLFSGLEHDSPLYCMSSVSILHFSQINPLCWRNTVYLCKVKKPYNWLAWLSYSPT